MSATTTILSCPGPHRRAGGPFEAHYERFAVAGLDCDFGALAKRDYSPAERLRGRRAYVLRTLDEQRSLAGFSDYLGWLCQAGAPVDVIGVATRMVRDEALHVDLCGRMVDALGGWPQKAPEPRWVRTDPRLPVMRKILNMVVGSLCIGEAISVTMIAGARDHASDPTARAVLTRMLADESVHASFGYWWLDRYQHELREDDLRWVARRLPRMLAAVERVARPREAEVGTGGVSASPFGSLPPAERAARFERCMHERILPGLERYGLDAQTAWAQRAFSETDRAEGIREASV